MALWEAKDEPLKESQSLLVDSGRLKGDQGLQNTAPAPKTLQGSSLQGFLLQDMN